MLELKIKRSSEASLSGSKQARSIDKPKIKFKHKMVSMANKRRDKDVMKIMVSGYKVELPDETRMQELIVDFPGPPDSPYVDVSFHLR